MSWPIPPLPFQNCQKRNSDMESARCKAIIESVERGSFRAAAEALGYTPSAVSQLVAALEKDLGLKLLIRSKRA